jgi:c-di-AMP phosphodiesterase-like protein
MQWMLKPMVLCVILMVIAFLLKWKITGDVLTYIFVFIAGVEFIFCIYMLFLTENLETPIELQAALYLKKHVEKELEEKAKLSTPLDEKSKL